MSEHRVRSRWPQYRLSWVAVWLCAAVTSGCASLTFPVSGIPASRLPPPLLVEAKEDKRPIDLTLLRQEPPDVYRLGPGDVLGIWIEGVLGESGTVPPILYPELGDLPPGLGLPVPVREDGTIALPLVDPVRVEGLSTAEAHEAIREAYTVKKQILQPDQAKIIVSMIRPRVYHVLVVREDSSGATFEAGGSPGRGGAVILGGVSGAERGSGHTLQLPAYENDVLNALTRTGGLPGVDATNEVIIHRRKGRVIRIPLRMRPGEPWPFTQEDIILQDGDVVFVEARSTEVFYTGGLLPTAEFSLPRDRDLDVLEAIAFVNGPIASGGISTGGFNLTRGLVGAGIGGPSPSKVTVLRPVPGGHQVPINVDLNLAMRDPRERILIGPGDMVLLQQTPGEAITRYFSESVGFIADWQVWLRGESAGTISAVQTGASGL